MIDEARVPDDRRVVVHVVAHVPLLREGGDDEERHADAIHHAVQVHVLRLCMEIFHFFRAENPAHMFPVVRHGQVALALQAALLHLRPVER